MAHSSIFRWPKGLSLNDIFFLPCKKQRWNWMPHQSLKEVGKGSKDYQAHVWVSTCLLVSSWIVSCLHIPLLHGKKGRNAWLRWLSWCMGSLNLCYKRKKSTQRHSWIASQLRRRKSTYFVSCFFSTSIQKIYCVPERENVGRGSSAHARSPFIILAWEVSNITSVSQ